MLDRYSISKAMYNQFDYCIRIDDINNRPLFYHEFYHHIQNISTILGGERFNLLIQFIAHLLNLNSLDSEIKLPLNKWYLQNKTNKDFDEKLLKRLENIVFHQDEWLYLDKQLYSIRSFSKEECFDEYIGIIPNEDKESKEVYIIRDEDDQIIGYPIGGFVISESGAYALELWHKEEYPTHEQIIVSEKNYQYTIILELFTEIIEDPKLACLATFLFCNLAMIISTPSIGFLALYRTAFKIFTIKDLSEEKLLRWYNESYNLYRDNIIENIGLELEIVNRITKIKKGLNQHINSMIEYQLNLITHGFRIRLQDKLEFIRLLLSRDYSNLTKLLDSYSLTIIETTNDNNIRFNDEKDIINFELLNACYKIFLGICRDVSILQKEEEFKKHIHFEENTIKFSVDQDGNNSDAVGFMIHSLGLNNKTMLIV